MGSKVLVTSALPYANGPIHFGHVVGAYLPADVYVRARRMMGHQVLYICGTDEHGVTIVQNAEKAGMDPQTFVDKWHDEIEKTFDGFGIEFDIFSGTSAGRNPFHAPLSREFFLKLHQNGYISDRTVKQLYCGSCKRFLADRYVEGTCPRCGAPGARGDECPSCGAWVDPLELKDPKCKQCGAAPVVKETRHWFLDLPRLAEEKIKEWFRSKAGQWKPNVLTFVENMLSDLKDRPITRDLDWGVPVPLEEAKGKVLYVWFDAPIGYISATMQLFQSRGEPEAWKSWWKDPECELIHFIGKDNIPFHVVVFPSMLYGVKDGYILPANVPANEFYNLEGKKFSTSMGWYIPLDLFFREFPTDAARYALIQSAPETKDSDFTWKGFQARVNNDLADNLGNLAARVLRFVERYMEGKIPAPQAPPSEREKELLALRGKKVEEFTRAILDFKFRRAATVVMELSREGNRIFDDGKPWVTRKNDPSKTATTLWACCETLRTLAFLCAPLMPETGRKIWEMLGLEGTPEEEGFSRAGEEVFREGGGTARPSILFRKIPDETVEAQQKALVQRLLDARGLEPFAPPISFEDFTRLDMRVGEVISAVKHPKADKLLVLEVDLGLEKRTIVTGIAEHYDPKELAGRKVIVLANLPYRKFRGIESQGMVLASTTPDGGVQLLSVDPGAPPGARIS